MAPTWLKPPRDVVSKIEYLLEEGRSDVAIRNHHSLVDLELTEQQVRDVRRDWDQRMDYEDRRRREAAVKSPAKSPSRYVCVRFIKLPCIRQFYVSAKEGPSGRAVR